MMANAIDQYYRDSEERLDQQEITHSCNQRLLILQDTLRSNTIANHERLAYLCELRRLLGELDPSIEPIQDRHLLDLALSIAEYFSDWPLVLMIYQKLAYPLPSHCMNIQDLLHWVHAHCQLGQYAQAIALVEKQLILTPENQGLSTHWQQLKHYQHPLLKENLMDRELCLIPMEKSHLRDFSWQYSASIQTLCNLPQFQSDDDWYHWFEETGFCNQLSHDYQDQALTCAVIHELWGFIGSVHLRVVDGIGFFYYWLGEDFQGQGFGPRMVNRLLDYGYYCLSMRCCYAKVYSHNPISQKALNKLGFQRLAFCAAYPYENECFYYLGSDKKPSEQFSEFHQLFSDMGCDIAPALLPTGCLYMSD